MSGPKVCVVYDERAGTYRLSGLSLGDLERLNDALMRYEMHLTSEHPAFERVWTVREPISARLRHEGVL